jgi:hypothetical protein
MNKSAALIGVMVLAILAACSQKAPPEKQSAAPVVTADDEESAPAAPVQPAPPEKVDRARMAAGMMTLLDTSPRCQSFRDQMEAAGKLPSDVSPNDMAAIVGKASEAGCTMKKGGQP